MILLNVCDDMNRDYFVMCLYEMFLLLDWLTWMTSLYFPVAWKKANNYEYQHTNHRSY